GKVNFQKVSQMTGIDLVNNPERITDKSVSVVALVHCMLAGTYTGKKLSDYKLPAQYAQARAIINGDVGKNGEKIAGYARAFESALKAGGYVSGKDSTVAT